MGRWGHAIWAVITLTILKRHQGDSSVMISSFSLGQNRESASFVIKWGTSKLEPFTFPDQEKQECFKSQTDAWEDQSRITSCR